MSLVLWNSSCKRPSCFFFIWGSWVFNITFDLWMSRVSIYGDFCEKYIYIEKNIYISKSLFCRLWMVTKLQKQEESIFDVLVLQSRSTTHLHSHLIVTVLYKCDLSLHIKEPNTLGAKNAKNQNCRVSGFDRKIEWLPALSCQRAVILFRKH